MEETLKKAVEKLGFDPTKGAFTDTVVKAAIEKVAKERAELKQGEVEKVIHELITLMEEAKKAEQQFNGAKKKIDKGCRKLLNRLNGIPEPVDGNNNQEEKENG